MSRQDHVIDVVEVSSSEQNLPSNETKNHNAETLEKSPPHNGEPISKVAISPRSEYVLTYSKTDGSFVGWLVKDSSESIDFDEELKNASTMIESSDSSICDFSDFKVSDNKVILYDLVG